MSLNTIRENKNLTKISEFTATDLVITNNWMLHDHAVSSKFLPWNFTKECFIYIDHKAR